MREHQQHELKVRYFDLTNQTIVDDHQTIQLSPRAFDVLKYLYERPGQLVTKQELLECIWQEVVTVEGVIKNVVCEIRKLLRDHASSPRYLQTVHRRGYKFIGVHELVLIDVKPTCST